MKAVPVRGLYAVTPDIADTDRLVQMTQAALAGGVRVVQYRNKPAPHALKRSQARALKTVCDAQGVALIVNDDVDLALEVDAAGVHVGREDTAARDARRSVGPAKLVGVSCYDSLERAETAVRDGADYVAFGSFFPSRVKPDAVRAPLDLVSRAKRTLTVPVVAIGGITAENAPQLVDAGVDAVAVISALFDAADITTAAQRFNALFDQSR